MKNLTHNIIWWWLQ